MYKLLSVYSILKPPKTGNCQILDSSSPKITYNDIKEIFCKEQSQRDIKINTLKTKLDYLAEEGDWDSVNNILLNDHNYCSEVKSTAKDCVIYYICGYMCRQVNKYTKCEKCLLALKGNINY